MGQKGERVMQNRERAHRRKTRDDGGLSPRLRRVRDLLISKAKQRTIMHYRPVADLLGIETERLDHCAELAQALDDISTFEHERGRPLLSVVVVHKPEGQHEVAMQPGDGFFKMAKRNGAQPPDMDDEAFFIAELKRAHDYWAAHGE